jgi:CheY-like chemotaxis protein
MSRKREDLSISTIILCGDDAARRLTLRALLMTGTGCKVLTVATGGTALTVFGLNQVDLVVLDHLLSDLSSAQVAGTMKQLKPEVPIVLLSGFVEKPVGMESVDLFVTEAMTPLELFAAISKLLAKRPPRTTGAVL